jgi:hypothetical protein
MSRPRNKTPKGLSRHQAKYAQASALAKLRQGFKVLAERYDMDSKSNQDEMVDAVRVWLYAEIKRRTQASTAIDDDDGAQSDCSGEIR